MRNHVTFRLHGRREIVRVSGDTVRVWDAVAGHFTTCHALPPGCMRYCLARARRALHDAATSYAVRGVPIPADLSL